MVRLKNVILGDGVPKICVPIVAKSHDEILSEVRKLEETTLDIMEIRGDFFEDLFDVEKLKTLLNEIRQTSDIPVLFTIRTSGEGGNIEISYEDYKNILIAVAGSGYVDAIDVECFLSSAVSELIDEIHKCGIVVVGSNHDFDKTDDKEVLKRKLRSISECGADVPKLAVMPQSKDDVISLLMATYEISHEIDKPIITMSMGKLGVLSRVSGGLFGSAMTFGTNGKASAPGQIEADSLRKILHLL